MTVYPPPPPQPQFEPNAEQLERDRALRRFNRLFVFLPLGVGALIAITLVVLLLIGVLVPGLSGAAEFASAMADLVIILFSLPLMLLCAILPVGYLAYVANKRQKRSLQPQTGPLADHGRIQILLWRLQQLMERTEAKTVQTAPKIAGPVIRANAFFAYLGRWKDIVIRTLRKWSNRA